MSELQHPNRRQKPLLSAAQRIPARCPSCRQLEFVFHRTGPRHNLTTWWVCRACGYAPGPSVRDADGYYDPPLPLKSADGRD